jgi:hypothetical protein
MPMAPSKPCRGQARAAQIGDTFALLVRVREQSRTELLHAASHRLLHELQVMQAASYAQVMAYSFRPLTRIPLSLTPARSRRYGSWFKVSDR